MKVIRNALEEGIDVTPYADPFIDAVRMKEARLNAEHKGTPETQQPNELQSQEILLGLQSGVDVSVYADPRCTFRQMEQIRIRLEKGIDPSELLIYKDN